ncbi:MAG: ribonuclease HI family protein [Candidatus Woesearchaeota archaeon]
MKATIHTDGACLGNPGPMGLGVVIETSLGVRKEKFFHGVGTNNVAEYSALLKALQLALDMGVTEVEAFLDSKLVVEQVSKNWRIKDEKLLPLAEAIWALAQQLSSFTISYVPREENSVADELSKQAAMRV